MQTDQNLHRETTIFSSRLISILVAIILFIALLYRQNNLALLTLLILLLMGSSKIWSRMSLLKVSCSIRADKQRLFPGETLSLTTNIENAKFLPVWVRINWSQRHVLGSQSDQPDVLLEAGLLWYQQTTFRHDLVARRRGCYDLGPSHIATSDVFGFFTTEKRQSRRLEIVVYPRMVPLRPIFLPKHDLFGTPGSQSPVKDPVYIIGTQDYQPARPARHIHWKASARHLKLQEKVFEPSEQGKIILVLDVHSFEKELDVEAFENTLEVIAALCRRFDQMGLAIGLFTNGAIKGVGVSRIPAGRGTHQLTAILETLGRIQMRSQGSIASILKQFNGPYRGASWAYFCYQSDETAADVHTYCKACNTPFVRFAWQLESPTNNGHDADLSDVVCINNIRMDHEEAA